MIKINKPSRDVVPTVFITKNKQRVKQFENNIVYLNNGDEFQLELFNPTTNKILAKILLNENLIGSGIVLRPGERVFLERYLDVAKKFLFETYNVKGNNSEVLKAIEKNGNVSVEFYCEQIITYPSIFYGSTTGTGFGGSVPSTFTYTNTAGCNVPTASCGEPTITAACGETTITASCGFGTHSGSLKAQKNTHEKETGRIEKGGNSDQSFQYDNTAFNYFYTWKTDWKILPKSELVYNEDIKIYCVSCGKKKKSSDKYCGNCGTKF